MPADVKARSGSCASHSCPDAAGTAATTTPFAISERIARYARWRRRRRARTRHAAPGTGRAGRIAPGQRLPARRSCAPGRRRSPPGQGRAEPRRRSRGGVCAGPRQGRARRRCRRPVREQHPAGRRTLRGNRFGRRGHAARRPLAGDVQDAAALPCRDVDRLAELARQPAGGRHDHLAVPARGQHRPREPQRSPAEPVAAARQPLRQSDAGQLSQQRVRGRLGDPQLVRHPGRSPIRTLDREQIEHQGCFATLAGIEEA